jgi:hypothetical protein
MSGTRTELITAMISAVTDAHPSSPFSTDSEYPVTREVIYFYFHPAISELIHI